MTALEQAKTLFKFDNKLEGCIDDALSPATRELRVRLLVKEFSRYMNTSDTCNIISISQNPDNTNYSDILVDGNYPKKFEMIIINGTSDYNGYYDVLNSVSGVLTVKKTFTSTDTGTIENDSLNDFKMAHSWLILYYSTFTLQKLYEDGVIIKTEQWGEGNITISMQSEIETVRRQYLRNAELLIGKLK